MSDTLVRIFQVEISQADQSQAYSGYIVFRVQIELAVDMLRACVITGARDAWRVPAMPGTSGISGHHIWHPWILRL